jgi:hypothetical protein
MRRLVRYFLPLTLICCALFGCRNSRHAPEAQRSDAPLPWFEDVSDRLGVGFVHDPGPVDHYFMPANIGSGVALIDYNNDGRLDIYLIQNAWP